MRQLGVISCMVAALLATACASDTVPAEQAVKAAEAAVAAVGAEAAKPVPDQAKALDMALAKMERQVRRYKDRITNHKPHKGRAARVRQTVLRYNSPR